MTLDNKLEFFAQTRHSYGKTALFLSGGAGFGKFHAGFLKALYEQDLFPRIICGSSIGGMIAAAVASHKYSDLWMAFRPDILIEKKVAFHFNDIYELFDKLRKGKPVVSIDQLKTFIYKYVKDKTFLEIYNENKWTLNITVTNSQNWGE